MANIPLLYWRKAKKAEPLTASPFKSEEEFERTVFDTPDVLGDIYPLKRQIRGGSKPGIPDIVGIDADGAVCVIEMKNSNVDAGVIPQVLKYAIWAETNPDSIKALWLEAKDRPEGREINWEDYEVRILVIAPSIDRNTVENVTKINYQVDLFEITRWAKGNQSWLLVNKLEPPQSKRVKPVSGLKVYDQSAYESMFNPRSVPGFLQTCRAMQEFCVKNKWPVEGKYNKHYYACKVGNSIVFGVHWIGSRSYALFFKVPEFYAKKTRVTGYKMHMYQKQWHRAVFPVTADHLHLKNFKPFLQTALKQRQ
jgi:hypothetical protein